MRYVKYQLKYTGTIEITVPGEDGQEEFWEALEQAASMHKLDEDELEYHDHEEFEDD